MEFGYILAIIFAVLWVGFVLIERGKKKKQKNKADDNISDYIISQYDD